MAISVPCICMEKTGIFFDDDSDGGLTRTDPEDIDYVNKENLKAFYLRRTEKNPHHCLLRRDKLQLVKEELAERPSQLGPICL